MTGRLLPIVALLGLPLLAGCQGPGPLISRRTTMGSLKASASQLEFRNEQLAKQVQDLKAENRRFEDRLVQEEAENGDLAARLDDARNLLGNRGVDLADAPRTTQGTWDDPASDTSTPKVRRSTRSTRKPPSAAIPGWIEPADEPEPSPSAGDLGLSLPRPSPRARTVSRRPRDERWLPVARGLAVGQQAIK